MSRCGKTHLLERAAAGELPDEALREHAADCPRCRHELAWLDTELRLFRQRAAKDEVQHLWRGVVSRTDGGLRRPALSRALVGLAAAVLVALGAGRLLVGTPTSTGGRDASIMTEDSFEGLMTEGAFTEGAPEARCSRLIEGIGFHCGYLPAQVLASR